MTRLLPRILPILAIGIAACGSPKGSGSGPIFPDLGSGSVSAASPSIAPSRAPAAPIQTTAPHTFFRGRLLKNAVPLSGVTVYMREYPVGVAGRTSGSIARIDRTAQTDENGQFTLNSNISTKLQFGVMYDASSERFGGEPTLLRLKTNRSQALRVSYPSVQMEAATQVDEPDIDMAWDLSGMQPPDESTVTQEQAKTIFKGAIYLRAQNYELLVTNGQQPDSGSPVLRKVRVKPAFTWDEPLTGTFFYQINAFTLSGVKIQSPWAQITITP